jgi:hypothetical protein
VNAPSYTAGTRVRVVDGIAGSYAPGTLQEYVVTVVDGTWELIDTGDYLYCKCVDEHGATFWYGRSMILGPA